MSHRLNHSVRRRTAASSLLATQCGRALSLRYANIVIEDRTMAEVKDEKSMEIA
jgi:hypothetical protein